jgi:hypothetical protein
LVAAAAPAALLHSLWNCCWVLRLHQQLLLTPHLLPVLVWFVLKLPSL